MQQTCLNCGGELIADTIRHAVTHGSRVIVFIDVPARVCRQCGEAFFAGTVVDEMNRFAWALGEGPGDELSVHFHSLAAVPAPV